MTVQAQPKQVWRTRPRRLFIAPGAWRVISNEVFEQRSTSCETGGALTGRITDGAVYVGGATVYQDEITERTPGMLRSSLLELSNTVGLVGDWHSHVQALDATQSGQDVRTASRVLADLELACYVTLVAFTAGILDVYTRHVKYGAWLWQRDRDGAIIYEALGR